MSISNLQGVNGGTGGTYVSQQQYVPQGVGSSGGGGTSFGQDRAGLSPLAQGGGFQGGGQGVFQHLQQHLQGQGGGGSGNGMGNASGNRINIIGNHNRVIFNGGNKGNGGRGFGGPQGTQQGGRYGNYGRGGNYGGNRSGSGFHHVSYGRHAGYGHSTYRGRGSSYGRHAGYGHNTQGRHGNYGRGANHGPNSNYGHGVTPAGGRGGYSKSDIMQQAKQVAQQHGIPSNLFLSMLNHESGFNPNCIGDHGKSYGLGQTYTGKGDNPWFNPRQAMHGGPNGGPDINYQLQSAARELMNKYNTLGHHNWYEAIRRYNGSGPASYRYANAVWANARYYNYV